MFSLVNYGCSAVTRPDEYLNVAATDDRLIVRVLTEYQGDASSVVINDEEDLLDVETHLATTNAISSEDTILFRYQDKILQLSYESYIDRATDLEFDWRINEKIYLFKPRSMVTSPMFLSDIIAMNVVPFSHFYKRKPRSMNKIFMGGFPHLIGFIRMYPIQGYESLKTVPKLIKINDPNKFITNLPNLKYEQISDPEHPLNDQFQDSLTVNYLFDAPESVKPDQLIDVGVKSRFVDGNDYPVNHTYTIDVLSGFAPCRIVNLTNGQGSFRVSSAGLKPGESIVISWKDGVFERGYLTIPVVE